MAVLPGICYGQSDVDVSTNFENEAQTLKLKIDTLHFDVVYSSPLQRCKKLADYCGYYHAIADNRLVELDFGDWEMQEWVNITDPQLECWYQNWLDEIPTNGESFAELISRVKSFIADLQNKNANSVVIFTHAGVIRAFKIILEKFDVEQAFNFKVDYCDCVEFTLNTTN